MVSIWQVAEGKRVRGLSHVSRNGIDFMLILKEQLIQKWKLYQHLLTIMLFQSCMTKIFKTNVCSVVSLYQQNHSSKYIILCFVGKKCIVQVWNGMKGIKVVFKVETKVSNKLSKKIDYNINHIVLCVHLSPNVYIGLICHLIPAFYLSCSFSVWCLR